MSKEVNVFWFRRDMRLDDNIGFYKTLRGELPVLPIFIFDSEIINELPKNDARVNFIFETLQKIRKQLQKFGSSIAIYHGIPEKIFQTITENYKVKNVIANGDYEPYARRRDERIKTLLAEKNIGFHTFKDQVIFEKDEIVKADGNPYIVYTPYMRKWKEKYNSNPVQKEYDTSGFLDNLFQVTDLPNLGLNDLGFEESEIKIPGFDLSSSLLQEYEDSRNFPAKDATSHIGPHLRFGTLSIRKIVAKAAAEKNGSFLQELIWREFFMQILWHYPQTTHEAFKKNYDRIEWRNNESDFNKWKMGQTGYPMVDAGMRQLNQTGFMHNRVRMVVASFLCKHLLIDWRWGEAYFAEKLLDYEISSNVGNWQWAAGSGVDAAPYFRIFNPSTQVEKFDKNHDYIKKWIPEFGTPEYPAEMVDHREARERCLSVYKSALL